MLPGWAIVAIINWGPRILNMDVSRPGPTGKVYDYIRERIKENYNPSYTPPQGMPDADSKGEYPNTGNGSVVPPPMPDYDPNKPYDKYPNGGGTGSPQFPWDMESKRINFCKLRDNDCRCSISTL